jgi:hypothetical protein
LDTKNILKTIGATYPKKLESSNQEKGHLILILNRKKSWRYMSEANLRPFSDENDSLFLDKAKNIFIQSYKTEVFKAYKKAKTFFGEPNLEVKKKKNFFKSLFNLNKI